MNAFDRKVSSSESASGRLLVLFTRWPDPGRSKTRLIPALGGEGAAQLQRSMTERALARIRGAPAAVAVRFEGGDETRMRSWLGEGLALCPQGAGDLGGRMERALAEGFASGADAVVLVGSDCPECDAGDVHDAFAALAEADAVFGPARDGGYWLVGVRRSAPEGWRSLFAGITWGGPDVLRDSRKAAAQAGLSSRLLRTLADVDRPEDLATWERVRREKEEGPDVSVVIPALEEEEGIGDLVALLRRSPGVEVVVADGGSGDATARLAAGAGARVLHCRRGRAVQMNAGACAARGGILLFLHADTRPPEGFEDLVREALADPSVAGGAFSFSTDSPRPSLKAVSVLANARAARLGIVYGDQGIFARRSAFMAAGGFPELPIFEDWELVRHLRREGRFLLLRPAAVTSARRWLAQGVLRTTLANTLAVTAYLLGMSPGILARRYGAFTSRRLSPKAP